MVVLFLTFWGISILATPIHIPTNNTQGFPFLHILANTCYLLSFWCESLVGSIYMGLVFVSIQPLCVFWLENLVHLHLQWLLIGMYFGHFVNCLGVVFLVVFCSPTLEKWPYAGDVLCVLIVHSLLVARAVCSQGAPHVCCMGLSVVAGWLLWAV